MEICIAEIQPCGIINNVNKSINNLCVLHIADEIQRATNSIFTVLKSLFDKLKIYIYWIGDSFGWSYHRTSWYIPRHQSHRFRCVDTLYRTLLSNPLSRT